MIDLDQVIGKFYNLYLNLIVSNNGYTETKKTSESDFDRFKNRYSSTGSNGSYSAESSDDNEYTFSSNLASFFSKAFATTKGVASTVKDKVIDMDIASKLKSTGSTLLDTGRSVAV